MITPTYIARFAAIDAGIASTAAAVAISLPSRSLSAGTQTVVFVVAVVRFHVLGLCSICTFIVGPCLIGFSPGHAQKRDWAFVYCASDLLAPKLVHHHCRRHAFALAHPN